MTRILVTRPEQQATGLCELVAQQGWAAEPLPLLEIKPLTLAAEDWQIILRPPPIDWFIFISVNAVNFALIGNDGKIRAHCLSAKVAAVGQATANALQQAGVSVALVPQQGFNSEALLASEAFQSLHGQRCVIVRGVGGRELLAETLRSRGAQVDYFNVYARYPPAVGAERLLGLLQDAALDVLTISSAEALHNLLAQVAGHTMALQTLQRIPLVVISDRLRLIAEVAGFTQVWVSDGVGDLDVIKTIINLVDGEYSG